MEISRNSLHNLFSQKYSLESWQHFLIDLFGVKELLVTPTLLDTSTEKETGYFLGEFTTSDNYKIGLFQFDISNSSVLRRRVGLRQLTHIYLKVQYDAALVVFQDLEGTAWRFSFISDLEGENTAPKRYTYVFGDSNGVYNTPIARFIELYQKRQNESVAFKDMMEAFSVEVLTKEFYGKLFKWFSWAISNESGISFPKSTEDISVKIIRLITRMLFVWFIKQKGLVSRTLFDPNYLQNILKDFSPFDCNNGDFYNAILQNLFFATLNRAIVDEKGECRRFASRKDNRDLRNLYRYADMFAISEKQVIDLFSKIPFLNGGLFECLDKFKKTDIQQEDDCYFDGFSRNSVKDAEGHYKYRAFIPNKLFFNQDENQPGLINLLNQYNFTIEENRATDAVVSLDPELLGRVFENLLASYNEETKETVRKSTGSFYTPREIVDYMVEQSLIEYLAVKCGDDHRQTIQDIISGKQDIKVSVDLSEAIISHLSSMKILDPACGSGAFPMGCLLHIVDIIEHLKPDADKYQLKLTLLENCIYGIDIQPIAMLICKLRFFISLICEQEHIDFNDVEHNYGIDTLPNLETKFVAANTLIAADLRSYKEDWTEQRLNELKEDLMRIRHGHFHAKSQYAKERLRQQDEAKCDEIRQYIINTQAKVDMKGLWAAENQVKYYTEEIKKYPEKWVDETTRQGMLFDMGVPSLFRRDVNKSKRDELTKYLENNLAFIRKEKAKTVSAGFAAAVEQLTHWNPYDQNSSSPFFDAEWMFGVKDGFDMVIGNPPYISAPAQLLSEALRKQRERLAKDKRFKTLVQKWDLYIPFMEISIRYFLRDNGIFTMIVPYPLTNQTYGAKIRQMLVTEYNLFQLVDLKNIDVFETATVKNCIPFVKKAANTDSLWIATANEKRHIAPAFQKSMKELMPDQNKCVWYTGQITQNVKRHVGMHVLGDFCYISVGMVLNSDENEDKGAFKKEDLISNKLDALHPRKYIEAKDVTKYHIRRVRFLEYGTERCPGKLRRATFPELYDCPKLVFNCLGCVNATFDFDDHYLHNHSLYCAILWHTLSGIQNKSITSSIQKFSRLSKEEMEELSHKVDLRYLLGIMNSKYADLLLTTLRGGDYHIYPEHIRNIPIPLVSKGAQQPVIELVERILMAKKKNAVVDTSEWEAQIDHLVYELYELTEEEIALIESSTITTDTE